MSKFDQFKAKLRPGQTYRRADLAQWSTAVDRHLKEAVQAGVLTKLAGGLYYAPKQTAFGKAPLDLRALCGRRFRHLHDAIDKQAQADFGGHPAGAGVGRGQQPRVLQFLQHRTDRGGRQVDAARARQRLGADRLAAGDIALHHEPENIAGAAGKFGERKRSHNRAM